MPYTANPHIEHFHRRQLPVRRWPFHGTVHLKARTIFRAECPSPLSRPTSQRYGRIPNSVVNNKLPLRRRKRDRFRIAKSRSVWHRQASRSVLLPSESDYSPPGTLPLTDPAPRLE